MNQRLRLLHLVLVLSTLLLCSQFTYAQKISKIKGVITDSLQKPMAGATIIQVGGTAKTVADSKGAFELNAPADSYLQIEMMGYQPQTIKASEGMVIRLHPKITSLDDVVVVGYGSQKKGNLTTAVSTINTKEMTNVSTSNLSNILAGRAAGVFIQTGTGVPGSPSSVRIRSSSSWNSGGPIYVVDGIVRDQVYFDALDPNQVQDMTILKDAAAAAIYGSRSSDGVLLVTTKAGKKGKPTFQFNSVVGVYNKQGIDVKYLGMDESMDMYNTMHSQPGDARYNDYDRDWIHKNNPEGNLHVDELYRMPLNQRYSANVSGGNDMMTYFVAGSYYHENGFLPHMDYRKYNLRSNVQMNVTRSLTIGLNLNYNNGLRGGIANEMQTDKYDYNIAYLKYIMSPLSYAYIDGKPIATDWVTNPVEAIKNGGYRNNNQQNIDGLISLEYKVPFVKGLTVKGIADLYNTNAFVKAYQIQPLLYKFKKDPNSGAQQMYTNEVIGTQYATSPARPYIGNENERTNSYQLNGIVTYDTHFGDHHLNVTGVYEQADGFYRYSSIYKYNFPVYQTDQLPFASPNPGDTKANGYEKPLDSRVSYVGRVNYDFQSKYLLSASMRADGSSKFSNENRWGYFPAMSLGWIVSKENFMQNTTNVVDFLKLRMSYGITGNDNIPPFLYQEYYNASNTSYYLGTPGALQPTLDYNGMAQPNYTWEGAKSFDGGVEFNFLKHWNFTADFWSKKTYDILGQRILQTPVEFGTSYPVENYGKMDAKGVDVELGYMNGKIGRDFTFDVKANFGLATTKVVLKDKALGALPAEDPVGKPLNYLVGYHAAGILRTDADVAALPAGYKIFGVSPQKGMMNFQDVSGPDGKADGIIDNYDKVVLANYSNISAGGYSQTSSTPLNAPIAYGFIINMQYKAFALNAVFGGLAGYKVSYNDPWGRANSGNIPFPAYYADSYSDANPNGNFPKLYNASGNQRSDYSVASELNTFNGAFLRLKNINLSYSLPSNTLHKAGISSSQIFVSGANLFCFRKFKLYDPEVYSFGSYPIMKSLSVGINLQF